MTIFVPEFGFSAGSETVLLRVLPRWVEAGHVVVLGAPRHRLWRYRQRGLDPRVRTVAPGWERRGWRRLAASLVDRLPPKRGIGRRLDDAGWRDQARRVGASHVFVPWIVGRPPVDFRRPTVAMVMDLAWRHYPPGWFGTPAAELDRMLAAWLRAAAAIFPVSEATAAEVRAAFPGAGNRSVTVPHGSEWRGRVRPAEEPKEVCFFTPASVTPNKNHAGLLAAAIRLWQEGRNFRLVWTGADTRTVTAEADAVDAGVRALQQLYRRHRELIAGRLETRGFVDEAEVNRLYGQARRVVLVSTYEGFGLPLVEAFERGARVICSAIPPFAEQVSRYRMEDRATLVPADDEPRLVDALRAACTGAAEPEADEAALRQRLEAWTWDAAARSYLEAFDLLRPAATA